MENVKTKGIIAVLLASMIAISAVALVVSASTPTPSPTSTKDMPAYVLPANAKTGDISVLHVSVYEKNEVQDMLDTAGATSFFNVTQIGLKDFNDGNPSDLSAFDVIVFGVNDCYEDPCEPISRTAELKTYVENGGGIVWTHDSLEATGDYGADIEEPAGVDYCGASYIDCDVAEIEKDHEILYYPFDLGDVWDTIDVQHTHTTGGKVTTAEIIMRDKDAPDASNSFYLTVHEYGAGRVVVDEVGHSVMGCGGENYKIPSEEECQIFANALYWVSPAEKMISISTDKESYTIGEVVNMALEINRPAEYPQVMQLELELKEPCDEPDMLYKSPAFVMPAVFQWNVTVPMRIDYSIWVSGGEYSFIATLRDPSTGDVIARDAARFNIDDVPWMEKLKSLEKEMMKTVEEAEL